MRQIGFPLNAGHRSQRLIHLAINAGWSRSRSCACPGLKIRYPSGFLSGLRRGHVQCLTWEGENKGWAGAKIRAIARIRQSAALPESCLSRATNTSPLRGSRLAASDFGTD